MSAKQAAAQSAAETAAERDALKLQVSALQRENEALRAGQSVGPRKPAPPPYKLSEGERQDLITYGVTRSPWTGETIMAKDHGIDPATDEGKAAQEQEERRRNAQGKTRDANSTAAPTGDDADPTANTGPQPVDYPRD